MHLGPEHLATLIDLSGGLCCLSTLGNGAQYTQSRYRGKVRKTCCDPSDTRVLHSLAVAPDQDLL